MTLQQLKYIITIVEKGKISEAAKELYMTQPSLTSSVRELEKELNITLFHRTRKGITVTREGEEFLAYARQVVEQVNLIEEKYTGKRQQKLDFCVSTQHYSFAIEAFVDLLRDLNCDEYNFRLRETQTYEIIEDVAKLRSQVGVLYLNKDNESVLRKIIHANNLKFETLFTAKPHVFMGKDNPLVGKKTITMDDLTPYPRLSYEQGEHNSFYFAEKIQSTLERKKNILVRDRATLFNLLIGLNGYTICSGVINNELNGANIIAVPLEVDDYMEIGFITHNEMLSNRLGNLYIERLKTHTQKVQRATLNGVEEN